MILNKLAVKNFGPYRGRVEIELRSKEVKRNGKSVILLGGKNGAGKTNLFDAINLCLYGPISIGKGTSRKEYEKYLLEKIHRTRTDENQLCEASVSLEFTHAHLGIIDTYYVNRAWKRSGHSVRESLKVMKNGKLYDNLSQDQWDTFIKELIPPIIAQIFFFDGEKIRRLSGDRASDSLYLADSLKALLGIDLTERLNEDLLIYQKKISEINPDETSYVNEKLRLQNEKRELERQLSFLMQDLAGLEGRIERRKEQIKVIEEKIASLGGEFHEKRELSKATEIRIRIEIEEIQNRISDECQKLFPFSLCKVLCNQLKNRIDEERKILEKRSYGIYAKKFINMIIKELEDSLIDESNERKLQFKNYSSYLEIKCNELLSNDPSERIKSPIIDELSASEIKNISMWIEESQTDMPSKIKYMGNTLQRKTEQLHEIEKDLARVPSEDILKPFIEELNIKNQELGAYNHKVSEMKERISYLNYQLQIMDRQLRKYDQDAASSEKLSERMRLIASAQEVLKSFADSLRKSKIIKLEEEILSLFTKLCRKDDLISKITINQDDLKISIYDTKGEKISKKSLSSGERQIFAISILWALKKVSNRPIPVVIDTPLSRLDSDHRKSIVQNFFPSVSHQTIILSTDTEVNRGYYKELSEHISHLYHLRYDNLEKRTIVETGYFKQGT